MFIVRIRSKKTDQKDLRNLQFGWKSHHKVGAKEVMVSEEISTIKKKPSTFYQDNRKDALRASQELAKPHRLQAQGYERTNAFERLSFEKRVFLGYPASWEQQGKRFPCSAI
jgi:hypothetical protein